MKKFVPLMLIALLALGGFGTAFALTGRRHSNDTSAHRHTKVAEHDHDNGGASGTITTDASVAQAATADKTVDLTVDKAAPDQITIPVGRILQFNSKDGKQHRIALGQGGTEHEHTSATDSGVFNADEGWRVRFDKPGTFYFHDHLNPKINVLVVAYDPSN